MQTTNSSSVKNSEQGINVIDLLMYFAFRWKWFLLSVLICGGIAWLLYARAPLVYFRSATVIIKDPSNKTSTAGLDRYDNFINKVNVANEILQFRSKKLMREVVRRVHADISYQVKDGLRYNELYSRSPVAVAFPDALPGRSFAFTVTLKDSTTVCLSDWEGIDEERSYTVKLNDTLAVKNERLVVTATNYCGTSWMNVPVRVQKVPLDAMVGYYLGNIGIRQEEDESSILTLSLKDSSPARAEEKSGSYQYS